MKRKFIFSSNTYRKFRRYYIKSYKDFRRSRYNCSRRYKTYVKVIKSFKYKETIN